MKIKPWVYMNSEWIRDKRLSEFKWLADEYGKPSSKLAALMIYIVINIFSEKDVRGRKAVLTYNRLSELTGLSRALISEGTKTLVKFKLIEVIKSGRKNIYIIDIKDIKLGGWCKLPAKDLMESSDYVKAFTHIKLRSKVELHALKIFLYLAAVRSNNECFTMVSFDKIHQAVGIPERDITKAKSLLTIWGMIVRVDAEKRDGSKINEPNKYYLAGYRHLVK